MAKTWGNPHLKQPKQCSTNSPSFTNVPVVARATSIKGLHITELRSAIDAELVRRGLDATTWTDPTLSPHVNVLKAAHIDELRTKANSLLKKGDCAADALYCPQDTTGAVSYTDPTLTQHISAEKAAHINELRTRITALRTTCICEAEYCNYCADCGYSVRTCDNWDPCCNENQQGQCPKDSWSWKYYCGSINTASATLNPLKSWNGSVSVAYDGMVPWAMCNYTPLGVTWGSCEHAGGHNHATWDCKCNPYTWT